MTHHFPMQDKDYNLVSTLYHALQGVETTNMYMEDAKTASDDELIMFLNETQDNYRQMAEKAKELLRGRIG